MNFNTKELRKIYFNLKAKQKKFIYTISILHNKTTIPCKTNKLNMGNTTNLIRCKMRYLYPRLTAIPILFRDYI